MDEIERLYAMREHFATVGDLAFVAEINNKLSRLGVPLERSLEKPKKERAVKSLSKRGK